MDSPTEFRESDRKTVQMGEYSAHQSMFYPQMSPMPPMGYPGHGMYPMHPGMHPGMHPHHPIGHHGFSQTPLRENFSASLQYTDSFARATNQNLGFDHNMPNLGPTPEANDSWFTHGGHSLLKAGSLGPDAIYLESAVSQCFMELATNIRNHQKRINDRHSKNDEVGRNNALMELVSSTIDYLHGMMNTGQLDTQQERKGGIQILKHVLDVISDCKTVSRDNAIFGYFFLETTNLIAHILNLESDIEGSLQYLLQALEHTKIINTVNLHFTGAQIQRFDLIHSTIIPELLWNICQAQQYLGQLKEAVKTSKQCYDQSVSRVNIVQMRLNNPSLDNQSRYRLTHLMESLYRFQFKARVMKAQILVQMKKFDKAVEEFKSIQIELHKTQFFQGSNDISNEVTEHLQRAFDEIKADKVRQFDQENQQIEEEKRRIRQRIHDIENSSEEFQRKGGVKREPSSSPEHEIKSKMENNDIVDIKSDKVGIATAEKYMQRQDSQRSTVKRIKTKDGTIKVVNKYVPGESRRSSSRSENEHVMKEVIKLREELKKRDLEALNLKIDGLKTQQTQTYQILNDQLEQQKKLMTLQQEARFKEEIAHYQEIYSHGQFVQQEQCGGCRYWQCNHCNPPPSYNHEHGRPIYDPYFKCWTYPYAQNNPIIIYDNNPKQPPRIIKKKRPKPEVVAPPPPPRKQLREIQTQTLHEIETQTCEDKGTMAYPTQTEIMVQVRPRVDKDAAIRMIIRFFKKLVLRRRYKTYKNIRGLRLCRDLSISPFTGAFEILTVHVIYNTIDMKCMFIRFCIFDYQTMLYTEVDAQFENLTLFNAYRFVEIARPHLKPIPFEKQPFRLHIGVIKKAIADNLPPKYVEPDSSSSSSSSSSSDTEPEVIEVKPEPEIIYRDPPRPETELKQTQTEFIPEVEEEPPTPEPKEDVILYYEPEEDLRKQKLPLTSVNRQVFVQCHDSAKPCYHRCSFNVSLYKCMKADYSKEEYEYEDDDQDFFYVLEAVEEKWSYLQRRRLHRCPVIELMTKEVVYSKIRLPEHDIEMLHNYLKLAIVIEVHQTQERKCYIHILKLLRLKFHKGLLIKPPKKIKEMGCVLKYEFYLNPDQISSDQVVQENEVFDYQECSLKLYKCKVYRRIRWVDEALKTEKYKDWKIKVIQEEEPKTWDIMFLHRLPTYNNFESVKSYLTDKRFLMVQLNQNCMPRPIQFLQLTKYVGRQSVPVYSQTYFDLNHEKNPQQNRDFIKNATFEQYYLNQTYIEKLKHDQFNNLIESRMPETDVALLDMPNHSKTENLSKDTEFTDRTVLYEVRIAMQEPKDLVMKEFVKYTSKGAQEHRKMKQNQKKQPKSIFGEEDVDIYSSDESDDNSTTFEQPWAWEQKELAKIQLDEQTINHKYRLFWCTNTSDPSNVLKFKVLDQSIISFWNSHHLRYQFLIQNFLVKQNLTNTSLRLDKVALRIRRKENFDYQESDSLRDRFRAQDKNRTKGTTEKEIVTSLYDYNDFIWNQNDSKVPPITKGYLIQSCLIGNYNIRGQIWMDTLHDLNNQELTQFLDQWVSVNIIQKKNEDRPIMKSIKMLTTTAAFKYVAVRIQEVEKLKQEVAYRLLRGNDAVEGDQAMRDKQSTQKDIEKQIKEQEQNLRNYLAQEGIKNEVNCKKFIKSICKIKEEDTVRKEYATMLFEAISKKDEDDGDRISDAFQAFKDVFIDNEDLNIFDIVRKHVNKEHQNK